MKKLLLVYGEVRWLRDIHTLDYNCPMVGSAGAKIN